MSVAELDARIRSSSWSRARNEPRSPYQLNEPDGTWWEVGWDPSLGTFFAQRLQHPVGADAEVVIEDYGTVAHEIPTVYELPASIRRHLPKQLAQALAVDAQAHPEHDPLGRLPWYLRHDITLDADLNDETVTGSLATFASRIAQREEEQTLAARQSLPSDPVASAFDRLAEAADIGSYSVDQLTSFLAGLGIDEALARRVLDGSVRELDGEQIAQVCVGLHCSPFDLWGSDLARAALDIYPPERWPKEVEPLDSLRNAPTTLEDARRLLREFVAERALSDLRDSGGDPVMAPTDFTVTGNVEVTGYRPTAIIEISQDGRWFRSIDTTGTPTEPESSYFLAVAPSGDTVTLEIAAGRDEPDSPQYAPAGWDVDTRLAAAAENLRVRDVQDQSTPSIELVRFVDHDAREVWLAWDSSNYVWELAHDPRDIYPGNPRDIVLDHAPPAAWHPSAGIQDGLPDLGQWDVDDAY